MSLLGLGKPWQCIYANRDDCDQCEHEATCPYRDPPALDESKIPDDCPHTGCFNCPKPYLGECHFFSGD